MTIANRIIEMAQENGATLAGIANMEALRVSPSHGVYGHMDGSAAITRVKESEALPDNDLFADPESLLDNPLFSWPPAVRSVLVIGLSHPEDRPALDWWDGRGTPGNRILIDIVKRTSQQIEDRLRLKTRKLHYYVEKGGVFLKDAAVLAGLGCIGKNNMLVTPSHGPRVRLRALFLEAEIPPTGPLAFDPCARCPDLCKTVCPESAMHGEVPSWASMGPAGRLPARDGRYDRERCNLRMQRDVAQKSTPTCGSAAVIKFCRECEFVCPVGKKPC